MRAVSSKGLSSKGLHRRSCEKSLVSPAEDLGILPARAPQDAEFMRKPRPPKHPKVMASIPQEGAPKGPSFGAKAPTDPTWRRASRAPRAHSYAVDHRALRWIYYSLDIYIYIYICFSIWILCTSSERLLGIGWCLALARASGTFIKPQGILNPFKGTLSPQFMETAMSSYETSALNLPSINSKPSEGAL